MKPAKAIDYGLNAVIGACYTVIFSLALGIALFFATAVIEAVPAI